MKDFMAGAAAKAALCIAFAGLLMVYPNFLAFFLAAILVSYAVINVRVVLREMNKVGTSLARVFSEVSRYDDPPR
jgi:hypothetical protein